MATPILGVPITDPSEAPENHAAGMQAAFEHAETYFLGRFADASARDAAITAPVDGMKAWLDSPGRYEDRRDGKWVPEGLPREGVVAMPFSARPDNDRTINNADTSANATQLGGAVEFPVPSWAQDGDAHVKVENTASVRINGTAHWRLYVEWSFDAGASWASSQHVSTRASGDSEYSVIVSNGNGNTDITIPQGTTTVRCRLMTYRLSGTAPMEIQTSNTLYRWMTSFYGADTEMPVGL